MAMKSERKSDGEMCMHAVRVIQTSVSVELFCSLVSPGQGRALVSFSLSMSGQDCRAAECVVPWNMCRNLASTLEWMSRRRLMARFGAEKKCCLCCLLVEEPVWVWGFCCFQKLLTKGSSRRICSHAGELMAEVGGEEELGPSMQDWSLCHWTWLAWWLSLSFGHP